MIINYIRLTSPGITLLVMLTGFIGMWIASRWTVLSSILPHGLLLWSILGIGLASAGASVFNNCYDRDIDQTMKRTCSRPLPSGAVNPDSAFIFGLFLSLSAFAVLMLFVNSVSALLAALSIFIYSYLYTVVLKRRTPLATEIGGISGALPPVIGWVAVKGSIDFESLLLFAIMYLWQPPHFWSLASRYKEDYKNAGIPTMSVVRSDKETNLRSLMYVFALLVVSFLPYLIGMFGRFYLLVSLTLGTIYLLLYLMAIFTKRDLNKLLFYYSIIYLSLIFISMAMDIRI